MNRILTLAGVALLLLMVAACGEKGASDAADTEPEARSPEAAQVAGVAASVSDVRAAMAVSAQAQPDAPAAEPQAN